MRRRIGGLGRLWAGMSWFWRIVVLLIAVAPVALIAWEAIQGEWFRHGLLTAAFAILVIIFVTLGALHNSSEPSEDEEWETMRRERIARRRRRDGPPSRVGEVQAAQRPHRVLRTRRRVGSFRRLWSSMSWLKRIIFLLVATAPVAVIVLGVIQGDSFRDVLFRTVFTLFAMMGAAAWELMDLARKSEDDDWERMRRDRTGRRP